MRFPKVSGDSGAYFYFSFIILGTSINNCFGYNTVYLSRLCQQHDSVIQLTSKTATIVELDLTNLTQPCRVEVKAPPTHHISMLYTPRRRAVESVMQASKALSSINHPLPCWLTVSYPLPRLHEGIKMTVDLCSASSLEPLKYTELLPPVVILEWHPGKNNVNDILASHLVFAAVGRGQEICSDPHMFPCIARPHYSIYCIGTSLVCDGQRNCPYSGNDEDQTLCNADGNFDKLPTGKTPDNFRLGQGLQFLASEMLKKFIVSKKSHGGVTSPMGNGTEKTTVVWFDEESGKTRSDSLPNVLNHYGPWGYLMLGMLICGTVLMFCGLWECCCRRPKAPTNSSGPTLLIINQGAQGAEGLEVPATPGPPRYEDLDQPPSYSALFPSLKRNSTLIPPSPEPATSSQSEAGAGPPRMEIYTIDVPITPDTRPKLQE